MATVLKLAVCLFPEVTALDYQGPIELLGFLSKSVMAKKFIPHAAYEIEPTYIAYTKDPLSPYAGPRVLPDTTYEDAIKGEQFDIIMIPGGGGTDPEAVQPPFLDFLKKQVPGARYVLTICTGSWVLAQAGLLDGKRATTNKALFNVIKGATSHQPITWVPKARWVVDGNFWTSSGVTAGIDMANAFLEQLVGSEITSTIRGVVEASIRKDDEDEFATFHGLV